jgi:lysozyme
MDEQQLKDWIKKDEGLKLHPYLDTTGHNTIGWGRNLDNGINLDEAELMFENDFTQTINELNKYSWFFSQPPGVKNALINMNFNLGIARLIQFKEMITALEERDYTAAAKAALDSLWEKQVPNRAKEIAIMMGEGL